jgi:hypothetical protein
MPKTKPKTGTYIRLTPSQMQVIEGLAAKGILGTNDSEVIRALLDRAIRQLVETDYVRLHQAILDQLQP